MKKYESVNWYEKTANEVYDEMFDELKHDEQYPFFVWLMKHYPQLNIDWIDLFEDFKAQLFKEGKIDEVLNFVNWYQKINPDDYSKRFELIERDLCDYFIYKKDLEKLKERIDFIQQNPIVGIDILTIRLLYQLIYNGHYEYAVNYAHAVWKPINESVELYGFPAHAFINTIYVNLLQQHYEALLNGMPKDEDYLYKQLLSMGYENDKSEFNEVLTALKEDLLIAKIQDSILEGRYEHMLMLNIHFLKYMYHTYKLPFIFSEWIWNLIATTEIFGKQKGTENWFYINIHILDKYITNRLDSLWASNELEIFGKVWGLEYVFEFFYQQRLLSVEQYENMVENITYLQNEMMRISAENLWQMLFVFDWPKPKNYSVDSAEKELFEKTYGIENSVAYEMVVQYLSNYQIPERIKLDLKTKNTKENKAMSFWPGSTPYVKEIQSIGRNELCPCGSGKKYKKCCMN